ncbi:MAG: hypothetical protein ACPH86_04985, partial [Schleiferiaceae bacterium]
MVMELIDWQGHLAIFNGNKNTRPIEEIKGGFEDISERLAPSAGPMVSSDKQIIKYFLPTQLKKAGALRKHEITEQSRLVENRMKVQGDKRTLWNTITRNNQVAKLYS